MALFAADYALNFTSFSDSSISCMSNLGYHTDI